MLIQTYDSLTLTFYAIRLRLRMLPKIFEVTRDILIQLIMQKIQSAFVTTMKRY